MSNHGDFIDEENSQTSRIIDNQLQSKDETILNEISFCSVLSKQGIIDPPRQIPKRSYSLQPDMATGWKPKKFSTQNINNVFPIAYKSEVLDSLIKQVYKKKIKEYQVVYLGPRKQNSFLLHEKRRYDNPYPIQKKLDSFTSQRPQLPANYSIQPKNLKFNSDFECGNLDAAIYVKQNQYDLFMRVDSNTRGHNNWYYFTVQNGNFVGSVRFNICNFRREKSLYQRGLRPYFSSKKSNDHWKQGGQNIKYQKKPLRYKFLYQDQAYADILKTYITLSFTFVFQTPHDTTQFAYFIPYSYSRLLKFIANLKNAKVLPPLKALSGLPMPVLEITDEQVPQYNKKVLLLTARIHPGQSNGSFVAQGFLEYACSSQYSAEQFRKNYIAYVLPMLNPDGVVAGNYRTSLFGKDLNRTFNQGRKYAFPQSFHLLEFAKDLKAKHKQRFNLFIDLHGHSVKKNIFMYGPQFSIQYPNYYVSRELPKILSSISPYFRYFSCIFRISSEKSSTSRAMMNKHINVPFTYTMESSNGFYYDSDLKKDMELTAKKLKKMGMYLCQGINMFKDFQMSKISATASLKQIDWSHKNQNKRQDLDFNNSNESDSFFNEQIKVQEKNSDDQISEGNSDSQPSQEDFNQEQLQQLLNYIEDGLSQQLSSPQKGNSSPLILENQNTFKFTKLSERQLKQKIKNKKKVTLLPPINCLKRAKQKSNKSALIQNKTTFITRAISPEKNRKNLNKLSISQMVDDLRNGMENQKQKIDKNNFTVFRKRGSRLDLQCTKHFLKEKL